jgi:hypothetical protein
VGLGLQPVAVAAEMQRANLLARLADQIALGDQHFVAEPASGLAFRTVAPTNDRAAIRRRTNRQILEAKDVLDDQALAVHSSDPNAMDAGVIAWVSVTTRLPYGSSPRSSIASSSSSGGMWPFSISCAMSAASSSAFSRVRTPRKRALSLV